jgi:hypothetical protein
MNTDNAFDPESKEANERREFIESQTDYTELYQAMQALVQKRGVIDDDHAFSDWALA